MVILWNSLLLIIKEIYGFNKNIYLLVFFFWKWYYTVEIYERGSSKLKSRAEEKNNRLRMENVNGKKEETLKKMLKDVDDDKKREEIIHMLLEQKVSKIVKEEEKDKKNFSNKLSDFFSSSFFILFWLKIINAQKINIKNDKMTFNTTNEYGLNFLATRKNIFIMPHIKINMPIE